MKGNSGNLVKSGTTFAGWNTSASGSGTAYAEGSTFTIGTTDTILYAMWTTNSTYKVTYDGNGSNVGSVPIDEGNYETGATVLVKGNAGNLAKTGFSFSGWNTLVNGAGTSYAASATFKIISADVKLYAQWAVDNFTVSFNPQSCSAVAAQKIIYGGTAATPSPQPTRTGYTFGGWFKEATCTTLWNFALETVTADTTIFAKWTIISCAVSFDTKGGGTIAGQTVNYGAFATSPTPAPTHTGYSFGGWFKEESYTTLWNFTSEAVTSNITIYAKWTVNTYSVVFNTQGGSSIASQTVNEGGTVTTPATNPTRNGYTFNGWYNEAACTSPWNFTTQTISTQDTIYAGWTIKSYTVAFNSQGGSTVTSQTVTYGGHVPKPALSPTKTSYIFRGWYKETTGTNAWNFINDAVTGDNTLYAKWAIMDADSNVYTEVTIGNMVWMVENLKTTKYNDGTPITLALDSASWSGIVASNAYCWYNNDPSNKATYGALYGGGIVHNEKPLAPSGWHIPTIDEWNSLINILGDASTAGGKMKDVGTTYWDTPNTGATNSSGFKALPGGMRSGNSQDIRENGYWWTNTSGEIMSYIGCSISNTSSAINNTGGYLISNGLSVRCVRN